MPHTVVFANDLCSLTLAPGQQGGPGVEANDVQHPDCNDNFTFYVGSYPYTVQTYDDENGVDVLQFWVIHGMEHAHPDAPGDGPYTDPLGPDISLASYCFFAAHPMSGAPVTPEGCPAT